MVGSINVGSLKNEKQTKTQVFMGLGILKSCINKSQQLQGKGVMGSSGRQARRMAWGGEVDVSLQRRFKPGCGAPGEQDGNCQGPLVCTKEREGHLVVREVCLREGFG